MKATTAGAIDGWNLRNWGPRATEVPNNVCKPPRAVEPAVAVFGCRVGRYRLACRPIQGPVNGDLSRPRCLARGDIGLVDLNERVVAEALDVGAIVALPRLVAGVF